MTGRLFLVRHGRPVLDFSRPACEWVLDPAHLGAVDDLADSGQLPADGVWYCSPEPKARATAERFVGRRVPVVDDLREHERSSAARIEDFQDVVRRAFADPDVPAAPGWEPMAVTRDRVLAAVRGLRARHPTQDLVLVGHGTAWTVLVAALHGREPDLDAWAGLAMPDVWVVEG